MKRKQLLSVAAILVLTGAVVLTGQSATADVGDGNLGCNSGEICYSRYASNNTYQKHFWWNANHAGYKFTNVNTGATGQGNLQNGADKINNRDSSCDVKTIDDRGALPDDVFNAPNGGGWRDITSSVDNENDRHERHRCG